MVNPRRVLSVILLTDTLINIPLIVLALVFINAIPMPAPNWVKTLAIFGFIVFVCDLLPKVLALANPFQFLERRDPDSGRADADRGAAFAFLAGVR